MSMNELFFRIVATFGKNTKREEKGLKLLFSFTAILLGSVSTFNLPNSIKLFSLDTEYIIKAQQEPLVTQTEKKNTT